MHSPPCAFSELSPPGADNDARSGTSPTSAIRLREWRFLGVFATQVVGGVEVGFQKAL